MLKLLKSWKYVLLIFPAILFLALIIRLYNLTILPVFADEAIYIRWSQIMANEPTLRFLPLSDGKQPLYMWFLMFFVNRFSDPLFIGRLLSVGAGLSTLVGVFTLSYILFKSKPISLLSSFIYAISPFSVFFDRMALVDSTLAMFGIWTFIFAVLTAKTLRLDMAMLTGFTLGGALLTKSPALFFTLLIPASFLFAKKGKLSLIKLIGLWLVSLILAYGLYNILRLGPNFHLVGSRNNDYVLPLNHLWQNPKDPFIFHFDRSLEWLRILGPVGLILLIILGIFSNLKKYSKQILFLIIISFVPILVQSEFAKVFTSRYIYFSIPPLFILAGASASLLFNKKLKLLLISSLILFTTQALIINYQILTNPEKAPLPRSERSGYLEEWTAGTGIKEAAEILKAEYFKDPSKKIVVGTEGFFGTLPDGLQMYLADTPGITVIGIGLGIKEIPNSLVESHEAGNKTYLVANSSRLLFEDDFKNYGLEIIASFKKADRPSGFKEWVKHGQFDTFYLLKLI